MIPKQTTAVVLEVKNHGEADKIVTFYGQDTGKISGIAKGANRSRVRFVNKLELFSLLEISYQEGNRSSLVRIDQAELLEPFGPIRRDYHRYAAACLAGELVGQWTREADADPRIFLLLHWALTGIAAGPKPMEQLPPLLIFFEAKLLDLLGYRPDLTGCRQCGTLAAGARPYHFSLGQGGLICRSCNHQQQHGLIPLSLATARLLARAIELDLAKLNRLQLPTAGHREAQHFLQQYSRHLLQREINSRSCFTALCC
ncbi:DNA repair protein RecO [Desulfurivibrio sp. D14AmB]|uniref:DNA repair protein RecO n=1 Tax=Desulfurivibrio sp. D14AmB TaxID=3374370 RepID=UPI00376EC573